MSNHSDEICDGISWPPRLKLDRLLVWVTAIVVSCLVVAVMHW